MTTIIDSNQRYKKITLFLAFTSLVIVTGFFLCSCDLFSCEDTVLAHSLSPDRTYAVTVFERNCGATTDFVTHVNIQPPYNRFDPEIGTTALIIDGQSHVEISWPKKNILNLTYFSGEIFKQELSWGSVKIDVKKGEE